MSSAWKPGSMSDLVGETIIEIQNLHVGSQCVSFITASGKKFQMLHFQDCCETVQLEEIIGDTSTILDEPVLDAYCTTNEQDHQPKHADSWTWTFYTILTFKGAITLRWLGESNGYYSENIHIQVWKPTQ